MLPLGFDDTIRGDGPHLLRRAIEDSGRSAVQFAALLGVDDRTVRRWLADDREVPAPVRLLCALIVVDPTVVMGLASKDERFVSILDVLDELREGLAT